MFLFLKKYSKRCDSSKHAGCALNQFYERINRKPSQAEDDSLNLKSISLAIDDTKRASNVERDQANELEIELERVKAERNKYMIKSSERWIAHGELQSKYDALKQRFDSECGWLRRSREVSVARERSIKDGIVKGCQHILTR